MLFHNFYSAFLRAHSLRGEDLIIPESMTQGFGFTVVYRRIAGYATVFLARLWSHQKHYSCAGRNKSDSGIIEFSSLSKPDVQSILLDTSLQKNQTMVFLV